MKNCLILGTGRSGTSMLAGILHQAGYYMGDILYTTGLDSNPKGFFEWKEINGINEAILSQCRKGFSAKLAGLFTSKKSVRNPGKNQHWLLSIPSSVDVTEVGPEAAERIRRVIDHEPYCYKDPRFSYTLPVWQRFLKPDTIYICIFREPGVTVASILKECRSREYLADFRINAKDAYKHWYNMYTHILNNQAGIMDRFCFVHYNQVYNGTALPHLSRLLQVDLSGDFVAKELKRSVARRPDPPYIRELYHRLCTLAGYDPPV